jgi:hypothetical protein
MSIAPRIGPVVLAPGHKGTSLEEGHYCLSFFHSGPKAPKSNLSRSSRGERVATVRPSRHFAHRDFEGERSCSFLTREPRSADSTLVDRRRVTARGHSREQKGLYREAKGTELRFKRGGTAFFRRRFDVIYFLVAARNECRKERVVEASPQSLIARYGGSGKQSAREGPLYHFSSGKPRRVFNSPEEPAHAKSTFKGFSYLWRGPCRIKVAYDRAMQARFD